MSAQKPDGRLLPNQPPAGQDLKARLVRAAALALPVAGLDLAPLN
jgi:hypothetical protein